MIDKSVLSGYVLEELLASLLSTSGYRLLIDAAQDPDVLTVKANGLCIHGRGADHQVDVLGELAVPVQLTYPLRLFVEAKCRTSKASLRDARNAVGTINDVNQYYTPGVAQTWRRPYRRFDYRYALASTSGFSDDAIRYAVTHQLSLIDLSSESARWLREAVSRIADELLALATQAGLDGFPVAQMREALRKALGTWPSMPAMSGDGIDEAAQRAATTPAPATGGLDATGLAAICGGAFDLFDERMYVAWTTTPFLLFILPDDKPEAEGFFDERAGSSVRSTLRFAGETLTSGDWILEPEEPDPKGSRRRRLRFTVPPQLEPHLFGESRQSSMPIGAQDREPAWRQPSRTVTVQVRANAVVDLVFDPIPLEPVALDGDRHDFDDVERDHWQSLRRQAWTGKWEPTSTIASDEPTFVGNDVAAAWPLAAYQELLSRLRYENRPHAEVIEAAARNGGEITRSEVYALAGYGQQRTLRGFTRPPTRIAQDLMDEGLLDRSVRWPLWTIYRHGVRASHFAVPREFLRFESE